MTNNSISYLLWLMAVLTEAQEVIDEVKATPLYRRELKMKINLLEKEIEKTFGSDKMKEFYLTGGAEWLHKMHTDIAEVRELYMEKMNSYA